MIPSKVAHLVRLANAAGSEQEAAVAARQACRLLLELVGKDSESPEYEAARTGRFRPASAGYANRPSSPDPRLATLEREKRDLVSANQRLQEEIKLLKNPPKCIVAKFDSTCRTCGERIEEGEKCWWQPGVKGAVCLECS